LISVAAEFTIRFNTERIKLLSLRGMKPITQASFALMLGCRRVNAFICLGCHLSCERKKYLNVQASKFVKNPRDHKLVFIPSLASRYTRTRIKRYVIHRYGFMVVNHIQWELVRREN
jgi:hypothetical protein